MAAGGLAYAAIPDAGGVIHSCYTKSSGAWRVIDTALGQSCKANEAALDLYSKGGADLAFLAKTGKAADSELLDGQDSSAFLGSNAKAADSDKLDGKDSTDFLGANATAADSAKLGGFPARGYVLGGRALLMDEVTIANGQAWSFTCCEEVDLTPPMTVELRCDTTGNTTLVVSTPAPFRWWWDETFGDATPVSAGFQAEFGIGNGVARNSLRVAANASWTMTFDLDTSIGANCTFGWTWTQAYRITPG
jgi:hypothetical protein